MYHGSRVTRVTGQLTDGSRGSWVMKCHCQLCHHHGSYAIESVYTSVCMSTALSSCGRVQESASPECDREIAGSNFGHTACAPRSAVCSQLYIQSGSAIEKKWVTEVTARCARGLIHRPPTTSVPGSAQDLRNWDEQCPIGNRLWDDLRDYIICASRIT